MPAPALLNMFAAHTAAASGPDFSVYTGYFAEYDFSDTATITESGGYISAIADKNGGTSATQGGSNKPQTGVDTINGLNVGTFLGGSSTTNLVADIANQSQPLTIYIVLERTDAGECSDSGASTYDPLGQSSSVGGLHLGQQYGWWRADAGSDFGYAVHPSTGSAHILGCVFNNASSVVFVDSTETTGTSGTNSLNKIIINGRDSGDSGMTGKIGHVLVYTAAHDGTTRAAVRSDLQSKWATP